MGTITSGNQGAHDQRQAVDRVVLGIPLGPLYSDGILLAQFIKVKDDTLSFFIRINALLPQAFFPFRETK